MIVVPGRLVNVVVVSMATSAPCSGLVPVALCWLGLRFSPAGRAGVCLFSSLYIAAPATSALARELQRTLEDSGSQLKVLRNPPHLPRRRPCSTSCRSSSERTVVGLNASGQVRELQLRLR